MPDEKKKTQPSPSNQEISSADLVRQKITNLEHQISMDVSALLVLLSEGSQEQMTLANQKAKRDLIKFGPDMQKLAIEAGGNMPKIVEDYLDSVDSIVHSATGWIDEAKVAHCFNTIQSLHKELKMD